MKINRLSILFSMALLTIMASSCVTSRNVRYLTDLSVEGKRLIDTFEAKICPYDELRIFVLSNGHDEELLTPFNVMGNMSQGGGNNNVMGYLVDVNGDIQFPVLGKVHAAGLTRLQLQDTIATHLQSNGYINNPLVMVRFMNFKIFFLDSDGGKMITVDNERCTYLEALAMSGSLDLYSRRDRVGVMREVNGNMVMHYMDPRSTAIFDDDFFLLQQNDIIFTETSQNRFFKEGYNTWNIALSAVSSLVSIVTLYTVVAGMFNKR